jgi:hypothetical protein
VRVSMILPPFFSYSPKSLIPWSSHPLTFYLFIISGFMPSSFE